MARDGAGNHNLAEAAFVNETVIDETAMNNNLSDISAALTASIAKDGQTNPTANLPMATYRHTGVGNASARTDYAAAGQVQDGAFTWCGTAGGTADELTLTPSPSITAYAAGQVFTFKAGASPSTGAVTVAVSGLAAKDVEINDAALSASAVIEAGKYYSALYDGTQFQLTRISQDIAVGNGLASASGVLSVDPNNATDTAIAVGDEILFADADDSSAVKKDTVQGILDLVTSGLTSIASGSLPAAANVDITSIPATYNHLILQISGASIDTASRSLALLASTDNGSSFDASGIDGSVIFNGTSSAAGNVAQLAFGNSQAAAQATTMTIYIWGYQGGPSAFSSWAGVYADSAAMSGAMARRVNGTAINALRIAVGGGSGSFDAGTYTLYGAR